jgi:hypothetical protein
MARDDGGGWAAGAPLPALAPAFELLARTAVGEDTAAAATTLRVGGTVVAAERDGDRASYPLTAPLTAALAAAPPGGLVHVPVTLTTTAPGTIAVSPPRIVYDL